MTSCSAHKIIEHIINFPEWLGHGHTTSFYHSLGFITGGITWLDLDPRNSTDAAKLIDQVGRGGGGGEGLTTEKGLHLWNCLHTIPQC